jgi:hypothetical protein
MPNATMRTFVGVAKDATNTTLAAAAVVGATAVTVASATGITNASTIVIVDGPNSETRAVTAVAGNVLTVAALTYAHPANTYVYAQPTASLGPTDFIAITGTPTFEDVVTKLTDKGYRGSNVEAYASVDGVAHGELDFTGDFFPDTFGYLLGCMLGATDFTGGTPNQHGFSGNNVGNGQATPYVFYFYDVTNTRAYSGARLEEVTLKFDPSGLITYQAKGKAMQGAVVPNPVAAFSAAVPVGSWRAAATLAGVVLPTLITAEITFKRTIQVVQTQDGTQGPYRIFCGALAVSGKATFVKEDDSQINNFLNNSQPSLVFSYTQGAGATQTGLTIQMTKCNYETAKPVLGSSDMYEDEITFSGLANVTDATIAGGGYSPAKAVLLNAKPTGTYV